MSRESDTHRSKPMNLHDPLTGQVTKTLHPNTSITKSAIMVSFLYIYHYIAPLPHLSPSSPQSPWSFSELALYKLLLLLLSLLHFMYQKVQFRLWMEYHVMIMTHKDSSLAITFHLYTPLFINTQKFIVQWDFVCATLPIPVHQSWIRFCTWNTFSNIYIKNISFDFVHWQYTYFLCHHRKCLLLICFLT